MFKSRRRYSALQTRANPMRPTVAGASTQPSMEPVTYGLFADLIVGVGFDI
jgi:hypothetical protein